MTEIIFLIEEDIEGGYVARALGESIFTSAENMDELKVNIKEAVNVHFDENNSEKPKLIRLHLVKEELITL